MTGKTISSRRAFLKAGALVAAPAAAGGVVAVVGQHEHEAELNRLRAEAAIRDLHQDWLRKVNAGDRAEAARLHETVARVSADHEGLADEIELAADGRTAKGRFHLVVETEAERPLESTLAQMAAAQGEGMIRSSDRKVVEADYLKAEAGWMIRRLTFRDAR